MKATSYSIDPGAMTCPLCTLSSSCAMSSVERYVSTITLAYFRHLSHAILTPRYIFKDQFVGGDAPMLSIIQALQKPCQAKGLCKTSPKGSFTLCYILGTATVCHNSDGLGFHAATSTQSTLLTCCLGTAFGCRRADNLIATDNVVDISNDAECTATQ